MVWLISFLLKSNFAFAVQFEKTFLKIGDQKVQVELADDDTKREQGLMFRKSLADSEGMLFVFDKEMPLSFWMKNTLIDLSIGYFDKDRKLIDIQEMKAAPMEASPPSYPAKSPAMYALEEPKGWFQRKHIKVGTKFSLEKGPHKGAPHQKSSR